MQLLVDLVTVQGTTVIDGKLLIAVVLRYFQSIESILILKTLAISAIEIEETVTVMLVNTLGLFLSCQYRAP